MNSIYSIAMWTIAAVALIYFGLSLFNVPWQLRIRIIFSLLSGALIVGALGWPMVAPADPVGAISLYQGSTSTAQMGLLIVLGFCAGVVATLATYPLGNVLGPFAAPAGVAVLALNSGSMRQILLTNRTFEQESAVYAALRWELLFWLAICAAGYLGVWVTTRFIHTKALVMGTHTPEEYKLQKPNLWINIGIAVVATAVIVYFLIGIFAPDIKQTDEEIGKVLGGPGTGQIAFGVFVTVAIAAFVAKKFLDIHFSVVVLAATAVYIVLFSKIINSDVLNYLTSNWTIDYFSHTLYSIIPIQFGPFAVLGALTGYWIGVRMLQHPGQTE